MEPNPLQKLNKIDFGRKKPSPLEVIVFHVAQMIFSRRKGHSFYLIVVLV